MPSRRLTPHPALRACLPVTVLAVTAVKLALAARWGWTQDIPGTQIEAEGFLASWRGAGGHPTVFPLGYYALSCGALLLSQWTGAPFACWIKVPAILSDAVIALVLRKVRGGGDRAAALYLLNPVTMLLSVYHGQLHTAATAAAVLALWAAERGRWGWAGVALGAAVSIRQHFGLLLLPLLCRRQGRVRLAAAFAATVALTVLPLSARYPAGRLASPVWVFGAWGYGMLLLQGPRLLAQLGGPDVTAMAAGLIQTLQAHGPKLYWLWAAAFAAWTWRARARLQTASSSWRAALLWLVGLYAMSPGFGVQWLVWALPCWLIVDRPQAWRYSLLAGLFLAGSYWQWTLPGAYGVDSITANLGRLRPADLLGVCAVGIIGLATWWMSVRTAWRLLRS